MWRSSLKLLIISSCLLLSKMGGLIVKYKNSVEKAWVGPDYNCFGGCVYFCPSREDKEWRMDAIERREYAGKKANLAAAELAKLSRRVCDNGTGQSFISYITAKILDGIQVSIRNVHILYCDMLSASAVTGMWSEVFKSYY